MILQITFVHPCCYCASQSQCDVPDWGLWEPPSCSSCFHHHPALNHYLPRSRGSFQIAAWLLSLAWTSVVPMTTCFANFSINVPWWKGSGAGGTTSGSPSQVQNIFGISWFTLHMCVDHACYSAQQVNAQNGHKNETFYFFLVGLTFHTPLLI